MNGYSEFSLFYSEIFLKQFVSFQLILQDKPVVLGPNYETEAVCVNCLGK